MFMWSSNAVVQNFIILYPMKTQMTLLISNSNVVSSIENVQMSIFEDFVADTFKSIKSIFRMIRSAKSHGIYFSSITFNVLIVIHYATPRNKTFTADTVIVDQ